MIATFIGDAFQYLSERGDGSAPGPIGRTVLAALLEGSARARQSDEPLVVISHSFGGEIVYDILTHYAEEQTSRWMSGSPWDRKWPVRGDVAVASPAG